MATELVIILVLILLSAYFSSTELTFIVANKLKIEIKARKKNIPGVTAKYFIDKPHEFFSTILIGNNIVNIAFASLSALFLEKFFGYTDLQVLFISTAVLLLLGELIPKYFARELADRYVFFSALPLRFASLVMYPFVKAGAKLSSLISEENQVQADNISHLFDKEDIKSLLDESHEAGRVPKEEKSIISRVFELGEQRVYEAMRPRTEIVGVESSQTIDEAIDVFIDSGYSKLPVYEENLDNIKGVILAKDLFHSPSSVKEIVREVKFYPETKKSLEILDEFLSNRMSIAIVIDEFGGTAGIVTMEDIIEELFGEIKDEYDVEETIARRITKDSFLISGKVEIDHLHEKFNLIFPEGDYETLGGFIISEIGRIPLPGETFLVGNFTISIERADKVKIDLVRLKVDEEPGE